MNHHIQRRWKEVEGDCVMRGHETKSEGRIQFNLGGFEVRFVADSVDHAADVLEYFRR